MLLAVVASASLISVRPAAAQYLWIDTNGDGVNTSADVVAPSGATTIDVWLATDHNANGDPAVCASGDAALTMAAYYVVLRATNGTMNWGSATNLIAAFTTQVPSTSDATEREFGFYGGAGLAPGSYHVATLSSTVASGTPSIAFAPQGALDPGFRTGFGSACSGTDFDNLIKLGVDFTDAAGIAYGGAANHPPVLAAIADVSMGEGEIHDVPVSATDADGDVVTLALTSSPSWASLLSSPGAGTASGTVHLAPGFEDAGDASLTVKAADAVSNDQKTFAVHVANTNRAPEIAPIAAMNLAEGVLLDTPIQASDADGDACTFFVASGPLFLTVSTVSSSFGTTFGNLHAAPGFADAGTYEVIIGARDTFGAADSTTYLILVREQDRPPVVTFPGPISGTEGEPITFTISATDPDGDMVMYQTDGLPAGAQLTDQMNGTALFRWTPGFDQAGSYDLMITADDMNGSAIHGDVSITVADVTDPVAIARPDDMTVIEGDVQEQPLLGFSASGGALTFEKVSGPAFVSVTTTDPGTGTAHGVVHLAPGAADGGDATVTLAVTDGTNRDETSFVIHVLDASTLPGQAPFQPPFIHLGVGLIPHTVIVADMNEDGIPDLVTANVGANTLSIFPGQGSLAFGTRINLAAAVRPHTVVAKDLNHDGHLDLVVSHIGSNSFGVWLGGGNGTFSARHDYQLSGSPVYLGVYDFNEDGNLDVVATDQTHGGIGIALGLGDGTFGAATFIPTGQNTHGLVGADLNHDGHMDIAATNSTTPGTVSVLLGKGDGTFQPKIDFSTSSPHTVSAGDLDQDGDIDLVVCDFDTGRITIALGHGDGTFATLPEIPTGTNPHASAVGDVDGDGKLDIVVANQASNTLSMLLGRGGPSWAPKIDYPVGAGAHNVAIADLDGDHLPEVSCSNIVANTVTILKNRGHVTHPARVFTAGPRATLMLRASGPDYALHVESADGAFAATDIDLASVELRSPGTGSVDHIEADVAKGMTTADADQNGVVEAVIGFTRADLRNLFSGVVGRKSMTVTLQGRLADASSFSGTATIDLVGAGAPGKPVANASVAPNPLNPVGVLTFTLTRSEAVTVRLYDIRGRLVRRSMESRPLDAGIYRIAVDGTTDQGGPLASGVYFFRITTRDGDVSGRFAVLK
ncbi:MAG TPA: FG-GAP-like repeat-containing protein [Candidatus Eisenbacteria bacterium]|nr:FG-GAP-like repeat-containing protein [Candidatus Eisenbacteria bacterium]